MANTHGVINESVVADEESSNQTPTETSSTAALAPVTTAPQSSGSTATSTPASTTGPATESNAPVPKVSLRLVAHPSLSNVYTGQIGGAANPLHSVSPPGPGDSIEAKIQADDDCPACTTPLADAADINNAPSGVPGAIAYHTSCRNVMHTECLELWANSQPLGVFVTCPMCRGRQRGPKYAFMDPTAAAVAARRARWAGFAVAAVAAAAVTGSETGEDDNSQRVELDFRERDEGKGDEEEEGGD